MSGLRIQRVTVLAAAVALSAAPGPGATTAPAAEPAYEIEFGLEARVTRAAVKAQILAGAHLEMSARRDGDGSLALGLERDLEAPWKLFHVDPIGPFGRDTQLGAVITLPEASWEALAERRRALAEFASVRHASWTALGEGARRPPLDGAFGFVVIGSPRGRFAVELGPAGEMRRVRNEMTDRWLNGPFDRFIGGWDRQGTRPGAAEGYWFWNHGEERPFRWQPNTYRALTVALELLAQPLTAPGGAAGADWSAVWPAAIRVLETLSPPARGRLSAPPPPRVATVEEITIGRRVVTSRVSEPGAASGTRRTVLRPGGGVVSDRIELRLTERRALLALSVGYRPLAGAKREVSSPADG